MPHVIAITCTFLGMLAWLQGIIRFMVEYFVSIHHVVVSLIIPFLGLPRLITDLTVVPAVVAAKEIAQGTAFYFM